MEALKMLKTIKGEKPRNTLLLVRPSENWLIYIYCPPKSRQLVITWSALNMCLESKGNVCTLEIFFPIPPLTPPPQKKTALMDQGPVWSSQCFCQPYQ